MGAWEVVHWRDIGWTVRARPSRAGGVDYGDVFWQFEAFQISGDFENGLITYPARGRELDPRLRDTSDLDLAEQTLHADVKWDGCSNWAWDTGRVMWHACGMDGPAGVESMGELMRRIVDLASRRITGWDVEVSEYDPKTKVIAGEVAPREIAP